MCYTNSFIHAALPFFLYPIQPFLDPPFLLFTLHFLMPSLDHTAFHLFKKSPLFHLEHVSPFPFYSRTILSSKLLPNKKKPTKNESIKLTKSVLTFYNQQVKFFTACKMYYHGLHLPVKTVIILNDEHIKPLIKQVQCSPLVLIVTKNPLSAHIRKLTYISEAHTHFFPSRLYIVAHSFITFSSRKNALGTESRKCDMG